MDSVGQQHSKSSRSAATSREAGAISSCAVVSAGNHRAWYTGCMVIRLVMTVLAFSIPWPTCCPPELRLHSNLAPLKPQPESENPARIEYNGAILVCDKPVHDLGTLWICPPFNYEFAIRNEGDATGWFRVNFAMSGAPPACNVPIAPGETVYVPFHMRPDKLRGSFLKSASIKVIPDPDEACVRCFRRYDSEMHSKHCRRESTKRIENSYCIRRPFEAACEAAP